MLRHTLTSLGPKVLATRMVRDYVRELYAPATGHARALNSDYTGAADLAAWKRRVLAAWSARPGRARREQRRRRRPRGRRGALRPGVRGPGRALAAGRHGAAGPRARRRRGPAAGAHHAELGLAETYEGGRYRFDGDVSLAHAGAFGYTVRVLPRHPLLASDAELGVVALPV